MNVYMLLVVVIVILVLAVACLESNRERREITKQRRLRDANIRNGIRMCIRINLMGPALDTIDRLGQILSVAVVFDEYRQQRVELRRVILARTASSIETVQVIFLGFEWTDDRVPRLGFKVYNPATHKVEIYVPTDHTKFIPIDLPSS